MIPPVFSIVYHLLRLSFSFKHFTCPYWLYCAASPIWQQFCRAPKKKIVTFHNICFYHKHILITHFSHSQTRAAADQTPAAIHLPLKKKTQTPSQSATRRMKTKTFSSRTTGSKTSKTSPPPELVSRLPDALQEINRRLTGQNLMWWTVRWMQ